MSLQTNRYAIVRIQKGCWSNVKLNILKSELHSSMAFEIQVLSVNNQNFTYLFNMHFAHNCYLSKQHHKYNSRYVLKSNCRLKYILSFRS